MSEAGSVSELPAPTVDMFIKLCENIFHSFSFSVHALPVPPVGCWTYSAVSARSHSGMGCNSIKYCLFPGDKRFFGTLSRSGILIHFHLCHFLVFIFHLAFPL